MIMHEVPEEPILSRMGPEPATEECSSELRGKSGGWLRGTVQYGR